MQLYLSEEVEAALASRQPVVALESTVIAHGLPRPENFETALELEKIIRSEGATPATIAVMGGRFCVGLDRTQTERLAAGNGIRKVSRRDLAIVAARKLDGATTVAATALMAHRAGIKVFATGGIGGVHRGFDRDVSADLVELVRTPIAVVCSGPKIVLDLEATREWLETFGITVLGWQCDTMPAFYARSSGLPVDERVESASEVAAIIEARDELELTNAVLIAVPIPNQSEIGFSVLDDILAKALNEAEKSAIKGKEVTPFLLKRMSELTGGQTLKANIALLENNARVAAKIARAMSRRS
jgi:pseudouridine-5'-phosphate glycosidase